MQSKTKILLIQPTQILDNKKLHKINTFCVPPHSLPMVAALTPNNYDVSIIDEYIDDIDFDFPAQLVGITSQTFNAPRAYEVAAEFRKRGKVVVMGGYHASFLPNEAKKYVDSVVIGEAENVWPQLLLDYEQNNLKPFYENAKLPSLNNLPFPRVELLNLKKYNSVVMPVQTSRGCPNRCTYCTSNSFNKYQIRFRPVSDVVNEIKQKKYKCVFFIDDNSLIDTSHARELFEGLKPLNIKWATQCTTLIAQEEELLKMASDSGCIYLAFGLESLNQQNLNSMNKTFNQVEKYQELIQKVKKYNIGIGFFTVYGFDHDTVDVFDETLDFLNKAKVLNSYFNILTPYPGSAIFDQLKKENRILHYDWSKYDGLHCVFLPKKMKPKELEELTRRNLVKYNSLFKIFKRAAFTNNNSFFLNIFTIVVVLNRLGVILLTPAIKIQNLINRIKTKNYQNDL